MTKMSEKVARNINFMIEMASEDEKKLRTELANAVQAGTNLCEIERQFGDRMIRVAVNLSVWHRFADRATEEGLANAQEWMHLMVLSQATCGETGTRQDRIEREITAQIYLDYFRTLKD